MKVIKDNSKKRITCPSCDSILEYEPKDVKHVQLSKYIHCPICGVDIPIRSKKKNKKSKNNDCNDIKRIDSDLDYLNQFNYFKNGKYLKTIKYGCPKCIQDLHRSISGNNIYECFNCGYKIDLGGKKK